MSESKSEYIERNMKIWRDTYDTPFYKEFELQAMFEAEWIYNRVQADHVKTKRDWLDIVKGIKNCFTNEDLKQKKVNVSLIFLVDLINKEDDAHISINSIELNNNNIYDTVKIKVKNLENAVNLLTRYVKFKKPSHIYFDKCSFGYALGDSFKNSLRNKSMSENGFYYCDNGEIKYEL